MKKIARVFWLWLWCSIFGAWVIISGVLYPVFTLPGFPTPWLPKLLLPSGLGFVYRNAAFLGFLLAAFLWGGLVLLQKLKYKDTVLKGLGGLVLFLYGLNQLYLGFHWFYQERTSYIVHFSRFLKQLLPPKSVLTGNFTPTLALETDFPVHPIYQPRRLNWFRGALDYFRVTHFILVSFPDDRDQLLRNLHFLSTREREKERIRLLALFPMRNRRIEIWERFPRHPEDVAIKNVVYEGKQIKIEIENRSAIWPRILLLPDGRRIVLLPGEKKRVAMEGPYRDLVGTAGFLPLDRIYEFEKCMRETGELVYDPGASQNIVIASSDHVGQALCVKKISLERGLWRLQARIRVETPEPVLLTGRVEDSDGRKVQEIRLQLSPGEAYTVVSCSIKLDVADTYTWIWLNPGPGLRLDGWRLTLQREAAE